MAVRPTAGYDLQFEDTTMKTIGIIQEFDEGTEGDTEEISGMNDTAGSVVRRKGKPVDVGETITFSGKIDDTADGYSAFKTAMKARTPDSAIQMILSGAGFKYTGHAESFNETASRTEAVWNFSCTFYVNSTTTVTV